MTGLLWKAGLQYVDTGQVPVALVEVQPELSVAAPQLEIDMNSISTGYETVNFGTFNFLSESVVH